MDTNEASSTIWSGSNAKPDYFNCVMITSFTLLLIASTTITIVYILTNHLF